MKNVRITVHNLVRLSLNPDDLAHEGPSIAPGTLGLAIQTVKNANGSRVTLVMPGSGGLGWVLTSQLVSVASRQSDLSIPTR